MIPRFYFRAQFILIIRVEYTYVIIIHPLGEEENQLREIILTVAPIGPRCNKTLNILVRQSFHHEVTRDSLGGSHYIDSELLNDYNDIIAPPTTNDDDEAPNVHSHGSAFVARAPILRG